MKVLVKLGGTLLEDPEERASLAGQLAALAQANPLTVVHGGGKQVTRCLEQRGIQSRFVSGLRVSDENVIEAVTNVIAGGINKQLVAALIRAGASAVGLSGIDGLLTAAEQWNPELGFVGKPTHTNSRLLNLLVDNQYTPVIACIAGDAQGNIYNVNADQMAVSCAAGWHAEQLIFLTDVPGVKGSDGAVFQSLNGTDVQRLISSGTAHGGMQAKLEAAMKGLQSGIQQVTIASGRESNICARLLAGEDAGTRIALN